MLVLSLLVTWLAGRAREQRRAFQRAHYSTTTTLLDGPAHTISSNTTASNVSNVQPTHWDAAPPETFLSAVPSAAAGSASFGCDAATFFGAGGAPSPVLKVACDSSGADHGAMILERSVQLPAGGQAVTVHSVYGYAPAGYSVDKLVEKWSAL